MRMTRIERILADKTQKVSVNPLNPRHQRFINPDTDMKTALAAETVIKALLCILMSGIITQCV